MSDDSRRLSRLIWLISFLIGAGLFLLLLIGRGGLEAPDRTAFLYILCDAFFVPGVLLGGAGLLVLVSGEGAFDALHYGIQKLFSVMRREEKRAALPKTYFDFVRLKHAGGKRAPTGALLLTGLAFLLGAAVTLILYYRSL